MSFIFSGPSGEPFQVRNSQGDVLFEVDEFGKVRFVNSTGGPLDIPASRIWVNLVLDATEVARWAFIAPVACQVMSVKEVHSVVGGASAAMRPRKVTDTSAPGAAASGTVKELTTATFDLTSTINTIVAGTLSATESDLQLVAGDKIGFSAAGTLTGIVGVFTIELKLL